MGCSCRMFREEYLSAPGCFQSGTLTQCWVLETPPERPLFAMPHTRAGCSLDKA